MCTAIQPSSCLSPIPSLFNKFLVPTVQSAFHRKIEAIEVLCKCQAFVVKKIKGDAPKPEKAQCTWSRFASVADAWQEAKKRAGVAGGA